jgi:hypothetical protein
VDQAIEYMVRQCLSRVQESEPRGVEVSVRKQKGSGGGGCFSSSKEFLSDLWGKFKN